MEEHLKKRYTAFPIAEVVQAPLDALQGIEEDSSKEFRRLFHVETIEDLANFKYCLWAAQIIQWNDWGLSDLPDNVKENLDSAFQRQTPSELLQQKITAFSNIGEAEAQFLSRFYVETVEDLAYMLYFNWAQQIVEKKLLASVPEETTPKAGTGSHKPRKKEPAEHPPSSSKGWLLALFFLVLAGLLTWQFGEIWQSSIHQDKGANSPKTTAQKPPQSDPGTETSVARQNNEQSKSTQEKTPSKKENAQGNLSNTVINPEEIKKTQETKNKDKKKKKEKAQKQKPRYYTVKPGDSLNKIAYKFYQRYDKWPKIYKANRNKLPSPQTLSPGQRLKIP